MPKQYVVIVGHKPKAYLVKAVDEHHAKQQIKVLAEMAGIKLKQSKILRAMPLELLARRSPLS